MSGPVYLILFDLITIRTIGPSAVFEELSDFCLFESAVGPSIDGNPPRGILKGNGRANPDSKSPVTPREVLFNFP